MKHTYQTILEHLYENDTADYIYTFEAFETKPNWLRKITGSKNNNESTQKVVKILEDLEAEGEIIRLTKRVYNEQIAKGKGGSFKEYIHGGNERYPIMAKITQKGRRSYEVK